eukprot:6067786-Pleurochrysis_carterae.AAC.1
MRACALRAAPAVGTPEERRPSSLASEPRAATPTTVSGLSPAVLIGPPNVNYVALLRRNGV